MDYNFIKSSQEDADKEMFFAPVTEDDSFIQIDGNMNMAHIMVAAGIFPSMSQARNNGWNKPIPSGFTDFRAGKAKTRITILNDTTGR